MTLSNIIAFIPVRGGSKGIPRKNIKNLGSKPLLAYTIDAARDCELIDRVVVSTDDDEISIVAQEYGAEVVIRPPELAKDNIPILPVVQDFLKSKEFKDTDNSTIVVLQATNPFRTGDDISGAVLRFREGDVDAVLSVHETPIHPYRMRKIEEDRLVSLFPKISPEELYAQRQDLPPVYHFDGAIIVSSRLNILKQKLFYGETFAGVIIDPKAGFDIDSPIDWQVAEAMLNK